MSTTFGIIDIGSNTIRLNIYKIDQQEFRLIMSTKNAAGLVSYIEKKNLNEEGIEKLISVLSDFKDILNLLHVDDFAVFATASLRNIENSKQVIEAVNSKCAIPIDLLTGAAEGSLSFSGALASLNAEEGMYIDTGGGSTEVVLYDRNGINFVASMPVGSLNLYNAHVESILPTKKEVKEMKKHIREELDTIFPQKNVKAKNLAVTGGSGRVVRHLLVDLKWIEPYDFSLSPEMTKKLLKELLEDEKASIRRLLKTKPDRIHTLMPGLIIIDTIAKYIHAQTIQISTTGLREGYLNEKIVKH